MLTSERRESVEGVTDDIEWAFATLGTDIDPGIALRVATAALPMLGLTLDRVRSEDFFQAGAAVAASSQVGPYSRALWHWLLVDALCYDPTWASRLHSELDALERLAHSNNFRALLARAHLIRASIALGEGNAAAGRASLGRGASSAEPGPSARLLEGCLGACEGLPFARCSTRA